MSPNQPQQDGDSQELQNGLAGNAPLMDSQNHEVALVNLYVEISGESESQARSTCMFVVRDNEEIGIGPPKLNASDTSKSKSDPPPV